jgi:hypothetical protein
MIDENKKPQIGTRVSEYTVKVVNRLAQKYNLLSKYKEPSASAILLIALDHFAFRIPEYERGKIVEAWKRRNLNLKEIQLKLPEDLYNKFCEKSIENKERFYDAFLHLVENYISKGVKDEQEL